MPEPALPEVEQERLNIHYDVRPRKLSRWRRMQVPVIASAAYWVVRLLGPTLRFETLGWPNIQRVWDTGQHCVSAFWHRTIFSATWWARNRGVVVMSTMNFDGQWAQRAIERLGYAIAPGSSSRGGLHGLAVMVKRLEEGHDVAFTIDGPRGPRYVAKPGPVILARSSGQPIVIFHIGLERAHTFKKSWDLFQIPYPFSRAIVVIAPPIRVPGNADREMMERKHAEMQAALERVRDVADSWFQLTPQERERLRAEWDV